MSSILAMTNLRIYFFAINLFPLCVYANNSTEKQLLSDIIRIQKYDKRTRPLLNNSEHVKVKINFSLLTVHDLDMRNQELSSSVDVSISWIDEFLKWNTSSYGGLDLIRVPLSQVWKPDVILSNSVNRKDIFEENRKHVIIYNDGTVLWHSRKNLKTFVRVDTTYYPFEVQTFQFIFSKLYFDDTYQQNYFSSEDNVTDNFVSNGEWVFNPKKVQIMRRYTEAYNRKIFSDIIWQFEVKRGQTYYVWTFLMPATALSFVSVLTFLLSVKSSEKLTLAVFSFISIAVVIRLFNESLPSTSDQMSYFGKLLSTQLGIAGFVIIANVFISCIYHRKCLQMCEQTAKGLEKGTQTGDSAVFSLEELSLGVYMLAIIPRIIESSSSLEKSILEGIKSIKKTVEDEINRQKANEQSKRERSKWASRFDIGAFILVFIAYVVAHAWIIKVLFTGKPIIA